MTGEAADEIIEITYRRLKKDAQDGGYRLNPDEAFTKKLVKGLIVNENRYCYPACPCRLSTGKKDEDLDIICPCDYRDPDLIDAGACYCGLYVSEAVYEGRAPLVPVPERRPSRKERKSVKTVIIPSLEDGRLKYPVWRCRVCGYLCARDKPPGICPVCKATSERFEQFL